MTMLDALRRHVPLTRRYVPLVAVVAVQLLIVALVPSTPVSDSLPLPTDDRAPLTEFDPPKGERSRTGVRNATSASAVPPATGIVPRRSEAPNRPIVRAASGDRSHCKNGRQFDGITLPPPCVPKWTGANNGGATSRGVTAKTIKVIRIDQRSDPTLETFLRQIDLAASDEEEEAFMNAAERYINSRFELYGRKIDFETYKSTCETLPPQADCFRPEMASLVEKEKPFFVVWNTPISSASFDELSARKVLNTGGWQFSERFASDRRPYHWDPFMSGSRVVEHLAEYWCERLAGRSPTFAGPAAGKFDASKPRVLGVVTADDPANQQVLREFQDRVRRCGGGVKKTYSFQQDPDRAAEQISAGLDRMIQAGVTTLVCLCDAATPYFIVAGCDSKNYHPEHLVPGTGLMDFDAAARLYTNSTQWRKGSRPSGAFGIGSLPELQPYEANDALRVWRAAGRTGEPYHMAIFDWMYYDMVATLIQMAGPTLTPANVERGAFAAGHSGGWKATAGNVHIPKTGFGPRDYSWIDDAREVVWSATSRSKLDGKAGTYIAPNGGRRYEPGEWPRSAPNPGAFPP
jgi:hypothetical protein